MVNRVLTARPVRRRGGSRSVRRRAPAETHRRSGQPQLRLSRGRPRRRANSASISSTENGFPDASVRAAAMARAPRDADGASAASGAVGEGPAAGPPAGSGLERRGGLRHGRLSRRRRHGGGGRGHRIPAGRRFGGDDRRRRRFDGRRRATGGGVTGVGGVTGAGGVLGADGVTGSGGAATGGGAGVTDAMPAAIGSTPSDVAADARVAGAGVTAEDGRDSAAWSCRAMSERTAGSTVRRSEGTGEARCRRRLAREGAASAPRSEAGPDRDLGERRRGPAQDPPRIDRLARRRRLHGGPAAVGPGRQRRRRCPGRARRRRAGRRRAAGSPAGPAAERGTGGGTTTGIVEARIEQGLGAKPRQLGQGPRRLGQAPALDQGIRERLVQGVRSQLGPKRRLGQADAGCAGCCARPPRRWDRRRGAGARHCPGAAGSAGGRGRVRRRRRSRAAAAARGRPASAARGCGR